MCSGHGVHSVDPDAFWYVPGLQDKHSVAFEAFWYMPAGHAMHVAFVGSPVDDEFVPGGHGSAVVVLGQ